MRSSATPHLPRTAAYLALLGLLTTTGQAVDYYKANNTTTLTSAASWWTDAAGTTAATTAPANSTNPPADLFTWNNIIPAAQTLNVPDVGLHTIRILNPGGAITLDGVNGRTITTGASNGGIDMSQATQDLTLLNCFFRIPASGNTVGIRVAAGRTLAFGTAAQVNVRNNAGSTTLNINTDGVSTGKVTFAANMASANLVVGAGQVELNNPTGSSRNGSSTTTIGGGTNPAVLLVSNTSGSATGSPNSGSGFTSTVTVNSNGTLGGTGIIASTVTANANSILSPGKSGVNNGIGTLSLANLTLAADSALIYEANNTADADLLTVTGTNGLTLNGGTIFLYNPGTTSPLTATGTFNLINCSGAIGGTGLGALTIAESTKIAGRNYTLGMGASGITLTITTGATIQRAWDVDASGSWSTAANWTSDTIPDAIGTVASITGSSGATFTAPRTVTLDSGRTVGSLNLDSAQPVTLDNSGGATLTLNNDLAAATLTATGASHVVSAPLALTTGGVLATVDSAQLTLSGAVSGSGVGIVKTGSGTLLLTANNTYDGTTSVSAGTLQIGNGGTTGFVSGPIANNGAVRFNRSDSVSLSSAISGTGGVEFAGSGNTTLQVANTFSGGTTLSAGTLALADGLALQNSTLTYSSAGGSLTVLDPVTSVTLGGLAGDRAFPLTNTLGTALALTVGGNNSSTAYSGSPLGTGLTFTKNGTGTLTLTGTHAYSGNTLVSAGTLSIDSGTFTTAAASLGSGSTARILVNGGTLNASASSLVTNASVGLAVAAGTANFSGGITTDTGSSSAESFINVTGGTLNAASISLSRGSLNLGTEPTTGRTDQGLYVNGATATVHVTGALGIGSISGANSSVSTRIDNGSLTVDGAVTLGINNTTRWSVLDINGGAFTSTDTTAGVQLGGAFAGQVVMLIRNSSAVVKAQRIQFGQGALSGRSYLNLSDGSLYVGSGGMVLGSSAPSGTDVAGGQFDAAIRLNGGKLGATADWSSTIPVSINGIGAAVVTGADETNTPHTITLQGAATGLSALTKEGAGTVLFTSPATDYYGPTLVNAGTLGLGGRTSSAVTVSAGATLAPQGQFNALAGASVDGNLAIGYNAAGTPAVSSLLSYTTDSNGNPTNSGGPITLGAGSTLSLSGTGTLTGPAYVLVKADGGVTGTFASVSGLPAGYALDYAYDDDANTGTPAVVAIVKTSVANPYDTWATSYSLSGADADRSADPDHDGLSNLLEYALATSPVASDASAAYTLGRSGNALTLAFDHPADASLTYAVEASNDLTGAWSVVYTFAPFSTAGSEIYTDSVNLTVTPRRFLRLKVTPAP